MRFGIGPSFCDWEPRPRVVGRTAGGTPASARRRRRGFVDGDGAGRVTVFTQEMRPTGSSRHVERTLRKAPSRTVHRAIPQITHALMNCQSQRCKMKPADSPPDAAQVREEA